MITNIYLGFKNGPLEMMKDNSMINSQNTRRQPDQIQQHASNPLSSVWVSANAGTGKTKVLVDRLLRLLLPRQTETGEIKPGTDATKILCLTFTKAAASEMKNRVNKTLSSWAVMDDEKLSKTILNLTGKTPNNRMRNAARKLFAQIIDTPGGMKIMTIHSFCQSVLSRFPLESGLMPNFKIADERQIDALMNQTIETLIIKPQAHIETEISYFLTQLNETHFKNTLKNLMHKRKRIEHLIATHGNIDHVISHLYKKYHLSPEITFEALLETHRPETDRLKFAAEVLLGSTKKTDQARGQIIINWLMKKDPSFDNYKQAFLTSAGQIRAKIITKDLSEKYPDIVITLNQEAENIFQLETTKNLLNTLHTTASMLKIGHAIIKNYSALKKKKSLLDYNDQIDLTAQLLSKKNAPQWILYKLDNGIDHILVDEAQDTSPEQWQIIQKLTEEFFHGIGSRESDVIRTIFAVGDEKQSIYSFQDADPELFIKMAQYFAEQVHQAKQNFQKISMDINFRSSPVILNSVDAVFKNPEMQQNVSLKKQNIEHIAYHHDRPGVVELWPIYTLESNEIADIFQLPITQIPHSNPMILLCEKIADTIDNWLSSKRFLHSYGRPVEAGDIMILLQSRRPMMDPLIKALKDKNIPVAGTDRMILTEQLIVQDILIAIKFCLLQADDLTLAILLKSPLINMSEDQLFDLAHQRGEKSLWQTLLDRKEKWNDIIDYLRTLIQVSKNSSPFDFISHILIQPCPNGQKTGRKSFFSRLGLEVKDTLDELLNVAQGFEKSHLPSLQGFLQWINKSDIAIKRELSANNNQVRIMTVHGSKGLQAPIVFIPDAMRTNSSGNKNLSFYWPQSIEKPFFWSSGEDIKNPAVDKIKQENKIAEYNEYCRLLYVAMTRAEDELYVAGWTKKKSKNISDKPWYHLIQNAWQGQDQTEIIPFDKDMQGLRIEFTGSKKNKEHKTQANTIPIINAANYPWLYTKAPAEPKRNKPLSPSKPDIKEPSVQSPSERKLIGPYWRGSLIHKILQVLPESPQEKWANILRNFLNQPHLKLSIAKQEEIFDEIFNVLNDQRFQHLFCDSARSEVPIVGEIKIGTKYVAISGQIDRLLVQENDIWIVDYKTNRPPPQSIENVKESYLYQMACYYGLLKKLYPKHKVHNILLWTHIPLWMELPNQILDQILHP